MNFSNEWARVHSWYKVLIMIWMFSIICIIGICLKDAYERYQRLRWFELSGDTIALVSYIIFLLCVGILFHFIIYKGVYLNFYNKKQYNRCLKEINDLTLLLQQKIVTEKEYTERTSILKDELLKYHA